MPPTKAYRRARLARWTLSLLFILSAALAPWLGATAAQANALGGKDKPRANSVSAVNMPRFGVIDPAGVDLSSGPAIRDSGAAMVLTFIAWASIEPEETTPDNYQFAPQDRAVRAAAQTGAQPMLSVGACPEWACPSANGQINAANMNDYIEFMTTLAQRYSQAPYNVHHWEIFNEPDSTDRDDHSIGWGGSVTQYVDLLRTIVPIIKGIDPTAVVAMGGLAYDYFWTDNGPFNRDFLAEFLAAGGGQYTDYIGFHFYSFNVHWGADIKAKIAEIRAILNRYNYTGPLLCDEFGEPSAGYDVFNDANQATYIVAKYVQGLAAGLQSMLWYTVRDYGAATDLFAVSGLLRQDNSRKPSFLAYQRMVSEIGESAYLGPINGLFTGPSTLEGAIFAGTNGAPVAVVWNNSSGTDNAVIQGRDFAAVRDIYGNTVSPTYDTQGNVLLPTSSTPFYVQLSGAAPLPNNAACGSGFSDVQSADFYYSYVLYLSCRNIISGYSDGTFRPGANATRGQIAKIVVGAEGWAIDTGEGQHFRDVPPADAFFPFVETAYKHGVISGYGDGTFRPGDTVTRGQLSKIIVSASGWAIDSSGGPHFNDVATNNPFYGFIETAYKHRVISGYSDGSFRWGFNATRGQISKIVSVAITSPASQASVAQQAKQEPVFYDPASWLRHAAQNNQ